MPEVPREILRPPLTYHTGANRCRRIVACTGYHFHSSGQTQLVHNLRIKNSNTIIAFKEPRHLAFGNAANIQHFFRPVLVLHIQQEHTGSIGIIAGMHTRQNVVDIILGEHDLCDFGKVLRLVFLHPEDLGSGEACEGNVGRQPGQLVLTDLVIQVIHLLCGSAVIPKNCRTDNLIIFIQHHQAVHLAAAADTGNSIALKAPD